MFLIILITYGSGVLFGLVIATLNLLTPVEEGIHDCDEFFETLGASIIWPGLLICNVVSGIFRYWKKR